MSLRLCFGSIALAIALGAFGAHGLASVVSPARLETWETANQYHVWTSLILLSVSLVRDQWHFLITAGGVIFAGSLYLLVLSGHAWLGAITPIGGIFLISGLIVAAIGCGRNNTPPSP
ncbi:MAG: DUF423 domain-containing protein [Gammaproteobacteria bacterium]|nr:DUF423 domain-containing protein [Gammaproteobacteria bacterium]